MKLTQIIPAPVHRALLPLAHRVRHHWRAFTKRPLAGSSVFITDFGGNLLLMRHSYGPDGWALPGGGIETGEDPAAAAIREVREEVGLELESVTPLGTVDELISGSPHTAHLFTAICDDHPKPDKREVLEARFFPMHSLPEPLSPKTRSRLAYWREQRGPA
ncbi:MAG: NUDIX domain-containing protein [Pseudomonadota bacterium]